MSFAQSGYHSKPEFEETECPFDTSNLDTDRLKCGYVTVPENRQTSNGKMLRLAVGIMQAEASNPKSDAVTNISGGPGNSSLPWALAFFGDRIQNRDVVIIDYRGTGFSEPEMCLWLEKTAHHISSLDVSGREAELLKKGALLACKDEMLSRNIDLGAFGYREVAADFNDVREALGYNQWNIVGHSYGASVAEAIMRDYPESIRSVTLSSPSFIASSHKIFENAIPTFASALHGLFRICREDSECSTAYPNLKQDFYSTIKTLLAKPFKVDLKTTNWGENAYIVNAEDFVYLIREMLFAENLQFQVPQAINAFKNRDGNTARQFISEPTGDWSVGMYYSADCYDVNPDRKKWESASSKHPILRRNIPRLSSLGFKHSICEEWHTARATPAELDPVESTIPVLAISGELDPIITSNYVKRNLSSYPNSYHVISPKQTHIIGRRSNQCFSKLMIEFINDPSSPPDTSCVEQVPDIKFKVAQNNESSD